jgi:hypothetical protein
LQKVINYGNLLITLYYAKKGELWKN